MDTKKYEAFEKTVELQSLTKAAQELGKAGQAVSDWGHRFDGQTGSAAQAAQKAAQELSERRRASR